MTGTVAICILKNADFAPLLPSLEQQLFADFTALRGMSDLHEDVIRFPYTHLSLQSFPKVASRREPCSLTAAGQCGVGTVHCACTHHAGEICVGVAAACWDDPPRERSRRKSNGYLEVRPSLGSVVAATVFLSDQTPPGRLTNR